ncbi:hypothetical protein MLD38_029242 [Melastoma candidum]|uniref:Uncharacterized protein n=1 Tax=Melastoma candidum TaxID=119954 RepID=A0ACB9N405_9MYRT|nr:hypothetical protein MLD38_029242 [Melastoma candidum]
MLRRLSSRLVARPAHFILLRGYSSSFAAAKHGQAAFAVAKSDATLVRPELETPDGSYYLSPLDQAIPFTMKTIYCYDKSGPGVGDALKRSLAKALVHYYPLAGSMAISPQGNFMVDCTKKGVPFVEAEADFAMKELEDVRIPNPETTRNLVYDDPLAKSLLEVPLMTAQVTRFKCGGFTLGVGVSHSLADGVSGMNLVNSWAEITRGDPVSTPPFLDRTILKARVPPRPKYPYDDFVQIVDTSDMESLYKGGMVSKAFVFDSEKIGAIKGAVLSEGQAGKCSSFAAVASLIWRARSKALGMKPNQLTKLRIMVELRNRFENTRIPEGYFGNVVATTGCLATAGELTERPVSYAVGKIQEAVSSVTEDYAWSRIDYVEKYRPPLMSVGTLVVSSWARFEYGVANFGWGDPVQFGCGDLSPELCLFMPEGEGKKGIVVVLALPPAAMATFEEEVAVKG